MSTGAECRFTEVEPGRYTYWLQDWPYGDNPDGQTYGPFLSFKRAVEHLDRNHANPGGWSTQTLPEGQHVHEWERTEGQVKQGMAVQFSLNDVPADSTPQAVLEYIKTLTGESLVAQAKGIRAWTNHAWAEVTQCRACGRQQ